MYELIDGEFEDAPAVEYAIKEAVSVIFYIKVR